MKILDMTAGHRAIWFQKRHPDCTYVDRRPEVDPDIVADSCHLPDTLPTNYDLIVLDPPHMNCGPKSNMSRVYGYHITADILALIEGSAREAYRVSTATGLLVLKWNDHDIKLPRVFALMPQWEPLFGHITKDGPGSKTYWALFKKKVFNQGEKMSDEKPYVIVRTYTAGVFAGSVESRAGKEVTLQNARRLWYWKGAASLSQLAMEGVKNPKECKFPCPVDRVTLTEAIEILDVTPEARKNIEKVPVWEE